MAKADRSGFPRVKAVVLDLDGTLLGTDKTVSPRSMAALRRCAEAGIELVVATARPPRSVRQLCPEVLELAHMVFYNGGLTVDKYTGGSSHLPIDGRRWSASARLWRSGSRGRFFPWSTTIRCIRVGRLHRRNSPYLAFPRVRKRRKRLTCTVSRKPA
ncbi:HAD family hydrolase [Paenibacillus hamazuiensis]|uniref:HAD family hydrolase n=1 Tax=Paenibacillus hamazuiensis TaxID=2936508 RepID=UPI00200D1FEC|nr:HAD family hydrolase [Paenibacillus hamazuiensis]